MTHSTQSKYSCHSDTLNSHYLTCTLHIMSKNASFVLISCCVFFFLSIRWFVDSLFSIVNLHLFVVWTVSYPTFLIKFGLCTLLSNVTRAP